MKTHIRSCGFSVSSPAVVFQFSQVGTSVPCCPVLPQCGPLAMPPVCPLVIDPRATPALLLGTLQGLFARPSTALPLLNAHSSFKVNFCIFFKFVLKCPLPREAHPYRPFKIADLPPLFHHKHFLPLFSAEMFAPGFITI